MAFSKIAGLEVTPPRPSCCTMRASSPVVRRLRRILSSQTDCPSCASSTSRFSTRVEGIMKPHFQFRRIFQGFLFGVWHGAFVRCSCVEHPLPVWLTDADLRL